ncbi:Xaa-Pro peptidase family protein [Cytobacillus firmus]|uniref:M24 family metallopeptidase n=1 Tax=Cytobacillus firmus TaxID=1399 RepID=UPI001C8D87E4|nr:aminopeptidase P family protein [Cytobacillus firmus]MBX9976266.1 M24 family metallopeptidase [Cytobacillus firmus]
MMQPINKIKKYLEQKGYDGILLRKRNNFSWLTEGRKNHIVLCEPNGVADWLIFKDKNFLITNKMEKRRMLEEECRNLSFEFDTLITEWYESSEGIINELTAGKHVVTDVPFRDWKMADKDLSVIRSVLSGKEIENYRGVCQDTASILEQTCKELKQGMTELETCALLFRKALERDLNVQVALAAADERIFKYRHPIPTNKKLDKYIMIVICAERGGLVANATRFVHFGPLPPALIVNKEKLARIDAVMNANTVPGKRISSIIKEGIKQYGLAGFPEDWKLLHQGGLTGFSSREYLATPASTEVVMENQAYAWNPALPGVKSEDTILVLSNGIEFLTETKSWDYLEVKYGKTSYLRPDILVR